MNKKNEETGLVNSAPLFLIFHLRLHRIGGINAIKSYITNFIPIILFILIIGTAIADDGDWIVVEPIAPVHVAPGEKFPFNVILNNTGVRPFTSTIKFDDMPDCINKLDDNYTVESIPKGRSVPFNVLFKVDDDAKEGEYALKVSDSTGGIGDPDTWTDIIILISKNETKIAPTSMQTVTLPSPHTVILQNQTIDSGGKTEQISENLPSLYLHDGIVMGIYYKISENLVSIKPKYNWILIIIFIFMVIAGRGVLTSIKKREKERLERRREESYQKFLEGIEKLHDTKIFLEEMQILCETKSSELKKYKSEVDHMILRLEDNTNPKISTEKKELRKKILQAEKDGYYNAFLEYLKSVPNNERDDKYTILRTKYDPRLYPENEPHRNKNWARDRVEQLDKIRQREKERLERRREESYQKFLEGIEKLHDTKIFLEEIQILCETKSSELEKYKSEVDHMILRLEDNTNPKISTEKKELRKKILRAEKYEYYNAFLEYLKSVPNIRRTHTILRTKYDPRNYPENEPHRNKNWARDRVEQLDKIRQREKL